MSKKFLSAVTFADGLAQSVTFSNINGDDLPAITLRSLSDVSFPAIPGLSTGALLAYSGSGWTYIAPGLSGNILVSVGVAPTWTTPATAGIATTTSQSVFSARQIFNAPGDATTAIIVKGFSATQTNPLIDFQTSGAQTGLQVFFPNPTEAIGGPLLRFTRLDGLVTGDFYFEQNGNRFHFTKDIKTDGNLQLGNPLLTGAGFEIRSQTGSGVTLDSAVNNVSHATANVIVDTFGSTATVSPLLSVRNNTSERFYIDGTGAAVVTGRDAATNTTTVLAQVGHNTTGTAAAGFGTDFRFQLETSTTEDIDAASVVVTWVTATHASRAARVVQNVYDTAAREGWRVEASGSAPMIGFLGAAAVVRQTSGANLTNNVTSGGTDDTIADITDLVIYANDAAAIRNDIYQLARKVKQINDALRLFGLLT